MPAPAADPDRAPSLAVLASGSGTILEAILADGVPVACVLVDRPCRALEVAEAHGVPGVLVARDRFDASFDRDVYTAGVVAALQERGIDLVAMAGFMTVLSKAMFDAYGGRVMNTHPSLLPAFPGAHAVRDALAAGVTVTGCTVHLATEQVDHGPILAQEAVEVLPDDTEATLHERIKAVERRLYPSVIRTVLAELTRSASDPDASLPSASSPSASSSSASSSSASSSSASSPSASSPSASHPAAARQPDLERRP